MADKLNLIICPSRFVLFAIGLIAIEEVTGRNPGIAIAKLRAENLENILESN